MAVFSLCSMNKKIPGKSMNEWSNCRLQKNNQVRLCPSHLTMLLIFPVSSACYTSAGRMSHSSLPNSATEVLHECTRCWCKWNRQVSAEAWMMCFSATQMGNRAKERRRKKRKKENLVPCVFSEWESVGQGWYALHLHVCLCVVLPACMIVNVLKFDEESKDKT